jgi:protein-disulfide isomerase
VSMAIVSFPSEPSRTAAAPDAAAPQYPRLTDQQRQQFEDWYNVQPVVPVPIPRGTAKVVIVKFNDFQCPPCRQTYSEYKGILAKYTASGEVKFVLKHFPLESECNTQDLGHTAACESAAAYLMAEKTGTAEQLEQWLFANQGPPRLTPDQVRKAAADIGRISDFDAQYAGMLKQIRADVELGHQLGAESTPTFFINGHRIKGGLPPAAFEAAIELELKRAR